MQKSVYTIIYTFAVEKFGRSGKNSDDLNRFTDVLLFQLSYSIKITFLSFYNTKTSTKIIRQLYFIKFFVKQCKIMKSITYYSLR